MVSPVTRRDLSHPTETLGIEVSMNESIKKLLPDGPVWTLIYGIAASAGGSLFAFQFLSQLQLPQFRWLITALVIVVCWRVYWIGFSTEGKTIAPDGRYNQTPARPIHLFILAVFVSAVLPVDVAVTVLAWSKLADVSHPEFYSRIGFYRPDESSVSALDIPACDALTHVSPVGSNVSQLRQGQPHFSFHVKKRDAIDELIVEDIQFNILRVTPLEPKLLMNAPQLVYQTVSYHIDQIDRVVVSIERRDGVSSWKSSASAVFDHSSGTRSLSWNEHRIVIRDGFMRQIDITPVFAEPGLYEYSVDLVVRSSLSKTQAIPLLSRPFVMLVLPASTSSFQSPDTLQPSPGGSTTPGIPYSTNDLPTDDFGSSSQLKRDYTPRGPE